MTAFFLPNIRAIQCSKIYMRDEDLTVLVPDVPPPFTSPITTLHMTSSGMPLKTFTKFLRLPKALVEFSYRGSTHIGMNGYTMNDMGLVLSRYHYKSLEILTLEGTETIEARAQPGLPYEGDYAAPERIGSLTHFEKLRVIEVPLWTLVSYSYQRYDITGLLPKSLEIIKLSLDE